MFVVADVVVVWGCVLLLLSRLWLRVAAVVVCCCCWMVSLCVAIAGCC